MEHITEDGYKVVDTLSGVDVYNANDDLTCSIRGIHISEFMDENDNVNDERLNAMIEEELEIEEFLDEQGGYL